MPKIDSENANEAVKKTGAASESVGVMNENGSVDSTVTDSAANNDSEIPEEDITMYLDEFEISRLVMDSSIKSFEKSLNNLK